MSAPLLVIAVAVLIGSAFPGLVTDIREYIDNPPPDEAHDVVLTPVADGFTQAVGMIERDGVMLVVERTGRVVELVSRQVILDISDRVGEGGEQGLLGIAARGGALYYHYADAANDIVISRDGTELLRVPHPAEVHNGGGLVFGPDGYLYASIGDGSEMDDILGFGSRADDHLGAVLRLDPATGSTEIWAWGLRNPWRMSVDRATGDLWIGDAGEGAVEEIDRVPAGERGLDFGWSRWEGRNCYRPPECSATGLTAPVAQYLHGEGRCAVIGGYVYRGDRVPSLSGRYVFGDHCSGEVWSIDAAAPGRLRLEVASELLLASFAEDAAGELYAVTLDGRIVRLERR